MRRALLRRFVAQSIPIHLLLLLLLLERVIFMLSRVDVVRYDSVELGRLGQIQLDAQQTRVVDGRVEEGRPCLVGDLFVKDRVEVVGEVVQLVVEPKRRRTILDQA